MTVVEAAVSPDKSELVQDNLKHAIRMLDDAASSAKSDSWQMVFLNTATAVQTLGMMFQNLGLTEVASKLTEASHKIPKSVPRSLKGKLMNNARWNIFATEEARRSRFEEGKPADPTQNMGESDSKKWKEMHDEHKDNFKSAALDKELLERYQLEVDTAIASLKLARKNPKNPKRYFFSALHSMSTALGQLEPENGPWPASEAVMHAAEKINMLRPVTDFAK
jgi:hypothetical protein